MLDHPVFKLISSSVATGALVLAAVQIFQVVPLERALAEAKAGGENVKQTAEYLQLHELYLQEKARSEVAMKQLSGKTKVQARKKELEIEVREYETAYNDYKEGYDDLKQKYETLLVNTNFKRDLDRLNVEKEKFETILACMTHGCENPYYAKYNKRYKPTAYEQFKSQLDETNKHISQIYGKFDNCIRWEEQDS